MQDDDVDNMWSCVMLEISNILSVMCPLKTFKVPVCRPEWLTEEIVTCINDRNKYVGLYKRTGCLDFLVLSKYMRTKIKKLIFKEKRFLIITELNNNKKNPKKFWREINGLIKTNNSHDITYRLLDVDTGELVICGNESDYINKFYVNVGMKVQKANVPLDTHPVNLIPQTGNVLEFVPFTINETINEKNCHGYRN